MPESEESRSEREPDPDRAAVDRYLDHRERMLRYDRDYLERLKESQATAGPPREPAKPDLPWGHPICDRCGRRIGCELQQAMKKVDGIKASGPR